MSLLVFVGLFISLVLIRLTVLVHSLMYELLW